MSDFVNFKLAQKLKEKGFRKPCILYYNSDKVRTWFNEPDIAKNFVPTTLGNDDVLAPAISQVLKWLREEKKIHICIDIYDDGWFFDIASFYKEDTGVYEIKLPYKSSKVTPDYDSFEQAALAGIEYSLDNLI